MKNIVIIGAGQLGSRHLQGLKTANLEITIYVLDTNIQALELAEERYNQIAPNPKISGINFCTNLSELPEDLALVIVATGSLIRAQLTSDLLQIKKVENIVFEKFLFPSVSSYSMVSNLLKKNDVKAWVNCPRRMFPYFNNLKQILATEENIKFWVSGGEWGLGCNAIHFIDIFAYLINSPDYVVDISTLDPELIESKRLGYVEFTGTITGRFNNQCEFTISANKGDNSPPIIQINTTNYQITVNETKAEMIITNNGDAEIIPIQMLYQSQLTGLLAEQILNTGECNLTSFDESCKLHLTFLNPVVSFYNSISGNVTDSCPIT